MALPAGSFPQGVAITPNGAFAYLAHSPSVAFGTQGQDPIDSLIVQVKALITAGPLTENQGAGLIDKLEEVRAKLDSGQSRSADE